MTIEQITRRMMEISYSIVHVRGTRALLGVACVASVSNRVIVRKLERKQKKKVALVPAF